MIGSKFNVTANVPFDAGVVLPSKRNAIEVSEISTLTERPLPLPQAKGGPTQNPNSPPAPTVVDPRAGRSRSLSLRP
jgi:hypothetical protein